jgi:putative tricarboxylic transport membrane protein
VSSLRPRFISVALLLVAVAAWLASRRLEVWTDDGPGPGLIPKVALGLMAVLALAVSIAPGAAPQDEERPTGGTRTFLIYACSCAFMAGAVPMLGFVLPGLLAVLIILHFAEGRSWLVSIAYAAALIGTIVLLFGTALNVQFPDGAAERGLKDIGLL